jgi:hypothetical protein
MLDLILELFLGNPKLCTNYKHWINNFHKNMKQFYISTNKTCVLNLIWGWELQPLIKCKQNKWEGSYHSYLCHGVTFIIFSFNRWKRKKQHEPPYMCVCVWIHKFALKIFHENNIYASKKVNVNKVKFNVPLFVWNKY